MCALREWAWCFSFDHSVVDCVLCIWAFSHTVVNYEIVPEQSRGSLVEGFIGLASLKDAKIQKRDPQKIDYLIFAILLKIP
jgi:hypothetical protein